MLTLSQRSHTYLAPTSSPLYVGSELIKSIYQPDEAAFDTLIDQLDSLEQALGFGRGKWTALMFAVHKRRSNMVRTLLDKGADPNCIDMSTKKSCLHSACSHGDELIVSHLLSSGRITDINYAECADGSGEAVIHTAVKKCHSECVRMLLDRSLHSQICNINAQLRMNGQTPLWMACDKGDVEIVQLLVQYEPMKCDLNVVDNKGYTPLMKAVGKGHVGVVELLLDPQRNPLGAPDLTIVNNIEQCATMLAVRTNNYDLVRILLEHPTNHGVLFRTDYRGRSVLDLLRVNIGNVRSDLHKQRKMSSAKVKELLWRDVSVVLQQMADSRDCDSVPHLPSGIVRCISTMTY